MFTLRNFYRGQIVGLLCLLFFCIYLTRAVYSATRRDRWSFAWPHASQALERSSYHCTAQTIITGNLEEEQNFVVKNPHSMDYGVTILLNDGATISTQQSTFLSTSPRLIDSVHWQITKNDTTQLIAHTAANIDRNENARTLLDGANDLYSSLDYSLWLSKQSGRAVITLTGTTDRGNYAVVKFFLTCA